MTLGVGHSTADIELERLSSNRDQAQPITLAEYQARIDKVCELMHAEGVNALYLDATTSLRYFTGMQCYMSERLHGAVISADGTLVYICPAFEEQKTRAEKWTRFLGQMA